MEKRLGIITIGQSPRTDVVPDIQAHLGDHVTVIEHGALDDLSEDEIREYAPEKDMLPMVTRLRNGEEVVIGKQKLLPRLEQMISELDDKGMDLILLLCNGDFPDFDIRCLVVEPQRVVDNVLAALVRPHQHLGVLVPVVQQEKWVRKRLAPLHPRLTAVTASPYEGSPGLEAACKKLNDAGCELVVLYCMGFNQEIGTKFRAFFRGPVLVSSSIVARTVAELTT